MAITTTGSSNSPLTAAGVGSGLDVTTLVSKLVAAKRAPLQGQIDSQTNTAKTQISALGQVSSALSTLKAALASLSDGTAFTTRKVSTSDSTVLNATATGNAVNGSYNIAVTQLATAMKVSSGAVTNSQTRVGTGTLTVALGSKQMQLSIDDSHASLASIRDAINSASNNPGVTATIVTGSDGAHLVMNSNASGAVNSFTVSSSGGDGGLAALNYAPGAGNNGMKVTTAAQDALFTIDGMAGNSASNTVTSGIDGVTMTLSKVGTSTLSMASDGNTATAAVNSFVNAYNSLSALYTSLTKYDSTGNSTGPLIGDATLNSIKGTLSSIVSGTGGNGATLSSAGVTLQIDGTLKVDSGQLQTAMADGGTQLKALFSGSNGLATKLSSPLDGWIGTQGILVTRTSDLNKQLKDLGSRQSALDTDMSDLSTRYTKQFTALDTMLTKLNNTSSYLTQQFNSLNNSKN
ncbi:flagellar filament capping protein FliD [Dyella tabacisoli]|uniref:Flagellar hook-associated protein 2 n=1 Tax=Dyella tabacisoli TaxID=2282381 RepID=A0A369UJ62_9GAMM|nr:flagellar filament capping protein FliD [Dyella tabacisoli]RDD79758.1 flagellar hook protein [Dyella tabacisoli]